MQTPPHLQLIQDHSGSGGLQRVFLREQALTVTRAADTVGSPHLLHSFSPFHHPGVAQVGQLGLCCGGGGGTVTGPILSLLQATLPRQV